MYLILQVYIFAFGVFWIGGKIIKKRTKIILSVTVVLFVIIALIACAAFHFRSYIKAYMISSGKTSQEIQQMLNDKKSPEKLFENYDNINIRDFTEEERKQLANNELTEDEAIDLILGNIGNNIIPPIENTDEQTQTPPQQNENTDIGGEPQPSKEDEQPQVSQPAVNPEPQPQPQLPENDTQSQQDPALKEANEKVARLVAKLYVIKSQSNTRLEELEASWKAEYLATPYKERKGDKSFASFVKKGIKIVADWEVETDNKVNEVLSEVETLLKDSGQTTELVTTLRQSYEEEKSYTIAYYMAKIDENTKK